MPKATKRKTLPIEPIKKGKSIEIIMNVLLYSKHLNPEQKETIRFFINALSQKKAFQIWATGHFYEYLKVNQLISDDICLFEEGDDLKAIGIRMVLTLGGDGTVLSAVEIVKDSGIPILGVNMGRLGFLTTADTGKITRLIDVLDREAFKVEKRTLLSLESNLPIFNGIQYALNDFTILKRDTSSMITIHTYINGEFLNSYWADGIILCTPTGSTGYSLSCGGPIVFPNSETFVLTPVAPHNLNVRPLVIPDTSILSFEVESRTENVLCTLDARYETIRNNYQLAVKKADFSIHLVQLNDRSFLHNMRDKLRWGLDTRNRG